MTCQLPSRPAPRWLRCAATRGGGLLGGWPITSRARESKSTKPRWPLRWLWASTVSGTATVVVPAPPEMAQAFAVGTGRFDRVVMGPKLRSPHERRGTLANANRAKGGSSDAFDSAIHDQSGQVCHRDAQATAHSHRTMHTHPAGPNSSRGGTTAARRSRRCIGGSRRRTPRPAPGSAPHEPGMRRRLTAVCCKCPLVSLKGCVRPVGR